MRALISLRRWGIPLALGVAAMLMGGCVSMPPGGAAPGGLPRVVLERADAACYHGVTWRP